MTIKKRKNLYKKGKKQTKPHTKYYGRRQYRTHSASGMYTNPSRIPAAQSGAASRWHGSPYQCKQNSCFNQTGDISTLDCGFLKLVDKFPYFGRSISSTENDINMQLAKAWTAIDGLLIIYKSNLSDKKKLIFFQGAVVWILLYAYTTWTYHLSVWRKKLRCGARPYEWGTKWDSNSLVKVCSSC